MKQDTSISGLANKKGRGKVTIFIMYPLRTLRLIAMVSVALTLMFRQRKIIRCIRKCHTIMLKSSKKEIIKSFLPHCVSALITMILVRLYQETEWLPILLKELFIVSSMIIEVHLSFTCTLVINALKSIETRTANYYNFLIERPKRQSLMLYLEEPYMTKNFDDKRGISALQKLHLELYETMNEISHAYSFASFFTTVACRGGVMVNVYYYFARRLIGFFVSLILNFIQLLMICYNSEKIKEQNNTLIELLNNFDMAPLSKRMQLEFKIFEQQVRNMKVELTSFKLFTFNYQLIATTITTTMGYMILVKQMDA